MTVGSPTAQHDDMRAARTSRPPQEAVDASQPASVPRPFSSTPPGAPGPWSFPPRFSFGVATSAYQVEGGINDNNWADWERRTRPDGGPTVLGHDRCGRAADSWNRFDQDLALLRWLGVDCYRFSVEWSRIEPRPGHVDDGALSRYREWCRRLRAAGIRPMLTLHHFTEPTWVTGLGGFADGAAVDAWLGFVNRVVARLGDLVDDWVTVNEPVGYVVQGWLRGVWPPGQADPAVGGQVLENLLLAHADAYRLIHRAASARGATAGRRCQVGLAHHVVPFRPGRAGHPGDCLLARALDRTYNHAVPTALVTGHLRLRLPPLWRRAHHPGLAGTQDFLGVNHYYPLYARLRPRPWAGLEAFDVGPSARGTVDDLGCDLDDRSLGQALAGMARYRLPMVVTEHGICDGDRPDTRRCQGLANALATIARVTREGGDVRGYVHWSLVDNFEWAFGWGARFGLFSLDRRSLTRTPTAGARLYREAIARHHDAHDPGPGT